MASPGTAEQVKATRYVTPLREGGSMPGLMEADDCGLHVVKFRGAGQGTLALLSEVVAGELAAPLGIRVPALKLIDIDAAIGTAEPDPEIQELLRASPGVNLASDFLPGARTYSAADPWQPDAETAAKIVWFDSFLNNVDRSARNPNLLIWHEQLWAIDHGAALFRQHGGLDPATAGAEFPQIAEHVLLGRAASITEVGGRLSASLDQAAIRDAVAAVPEQWFTGGGPEVYVDWLIARLAHSPEFSQEAEDAR